MDRAQSAHRVGGTRHDGEDSFIGAAFSVASTVRSAEAADHVSLQRCHAVPLACR
jgi:hypothetical protein